MRPRIFSPLAFLASFQPVRLGDILNVNSDEFFYYKYPSENVLSFMNDDGDLFEIEDYNITYTKLFLGKRELEVTPDTLICYPTPINILRLVVTNWNIDGCYIRGKRETLDETLYFVTRKKYPHADTITFVLWQDPETNPETAQAFTAKLEQMKEAAIKYGYKKVLTEIAPPFKLLKQRFEDENKASSTTQRQSETR